ncbi:hypothetical protein NF212_24740 [Parasalinivibrio latis]|uniref:hypothetical protein n=1 Tax=Parasalinivibrio latis TaxID=2952610 RepID=UPI0030E2B49A
MKRLLLVSTLLVLSACSSYQMQESPKFESDAHWAIMPFKNLSGTPLAGQKAEQMLATALSAKGISVSVYPNADSHSLESILDPQSVEKKAQEWLKSQRAEYVITGSVEEWQYKTGLDSEPTVGISLKVIANPGSTTLWRATGTRTGWGREGLAQTGLDVITGLVDEINVQSNQ